MGSRDAGKARGSDSSAKVIRSVSFYTCWVCVCVCVLPEGMIDLPADYEEMLSCGGENFEKI